MWLLSDGRFRKPHMPMFNWEELGKISPDLLRTMRHITFGKFNASYDGEYFGNKKKMYGKKEVYLHELDEKYKVYPVKRRYAEEWPSEKWNYQDKLALKPLRSIKKDSKIEVPHPTVDESNESIESELKITKEELSDFLTSIDGIGKKKVKKIVEHFGDVEEVIGALHQNPTLFTEIKGITNKVVKKLKKAWAELLK
jgi:hypothetical protein